MSRSNYLSYLETYDQSQTDALKRKFTGVSDNVGDTGYSECQKYEKI